MSEPNEHRRLRHARVKEILYEVTGLDRSARADFLETACAGDRELLNEVESLLAYHDGRLDGGERKERAPPAPAGGQKARPGEAAAVGELGPADAASGKPPRRARTKKSR